MLGDVRRHSLSDKGCSRGAKGKKKKKPIYILADSKMTRAEERRMKEVEGKGENKEEGWKEGRRVEGYRRKRGKRANK